MTVLRFVVLLLFGILVPAGLSAAEAPSQARLAIVTASGPHYFAVDVMRSREELEKGLMFRKQMALDKGMLFDFGTPQEVSMWMKNTYLALDMLFIGKDGHISSVAENAVPLSETIISSGGPITGVLEINAGIVKRLGIRRGDIVRHPMFGS